MKMKKKVEKLSEYFDKKVCWFTIINGQIHVYFDKNQVITNKQVISMDEFEGIMNGEVVGV